MEVLPFGRRRGRLTWSGKQHLGSHFKLKKTMNQPRKLRVFFSWQPDKYGYKALIETALKCAIHEFNNSKVYHAMFEYEESTRVIANIADKLKNCNAFVGDISPIVFKNNNEAIPDPNVLFEFGHYCALKGNSSIWLNQFRDEQGFDVTFPFDLRTFRCFSSIISDKTKATIQQQLTEELVYFLYGIAEDLGIGSSVEEIERTLLETFLQSDAVKNWKAFTNAMHKKYAKRKYSQLTIEEQLFQYCDSPTELYLLEEACPKFSEQSSVVTESAELMSLFGSILETPGPLNTNRNATFTMWAMLYNGHFPKLQNISQRLDVKKMALTCKPPQYEYFTKSQLRIRNAWYL